MRPRGVDKVDGGGGGRSTVGGHLDRGVDEIAEASRS
jgi:hypothetical protein